VSDAPVTTEQVSTRDRVPGWSLAVGQFGYATRDGWRNPLMTVLIVLFPLVFLIMLGLAAQDAPADPVTGVAFIQRTAPTAGVFAAVMASYVLLGFQISQARERGILKRLHGSPLPLSFYVAGRIGFATVLAVLGAVVMFTSAVVMFDLHFPVERLPVMVLVFVVGVACFAALGFAAAMVLRGSDAVLTFTMGSFLLVAFASGTFAPDLVLPRPLDIGSWVLPVRHFATAFGDQFDPSVAGAGLAWEHLAVLVAWLLAAAWLGLRRFSAEPATARPMSTARRPMWSRRRTATVSVGTAPAGRRPGPVRLVWGQLHQANQQVWRQPGSVFFAVLFPLLFVAVVPYAFGRPVIAGVELARIVTPAMAVFGAVVAAFVNLPEAVAIARESGVLKRLRGTPLPAGAYVAGRLGSALYIGLLAVLGAFFAGWVVHGVTVPAGSVPALLVVFVVGIPALTALGLALVALVPDAKTVPAVALGVFLPLAFISDILAFGMELPAALQTAGWLFPFKHLVHAVEIGLDTGQVSLGHLAVVVGWGVAGALVAVLRFRWQPRPG
jgi:ABC-2 type transport system permease protein